MRARILLPLVVALSGVAAAGETPQAPTRYFNDYAGFVSGDVAERLEARLRQFDQQTSSQVVVAVFPELPSPSMEDFTARTARAWRVGRKELDNGVVLFVFVKDRKLRLEVGYGLEGALPDAVAKRIVQDVIGPRFRAGDPAGGLEAGIEAIVAATKGEYRAPAQGISGDELNAVFGGVLIFIIVLAVLLVLAARAAGFRGGGSGGWTHTGSGSTWSSSDWSSGGGGDSGGFSGGGGDFGGGGASGSW